VIGGGGGDISYKEVPLVEKLALARKATTPASSSMEARTVIETALKTTRFTFTLPPPDSSAILTHAGEDIVIARGQFPDAPEGIRSYVLWNEPASESLLLEVAAQELRTRESVQRLLTRVFEWDPHGRLSLALAVASPRSDGVEFLRGSTRDNVFRQFNTNLEEISGMINGADAWLSISYRHGAGYPPEMVNFPERFPPLRARITQWNKTELMTAIENPGRARFMVAGDIARTRMLMLALFARADFDHNDFRKLMAVVVNTGMADLVPFAVRTAVQARVDGRYTSEIMGYFRDRFAKHPSAMTFQAPVYMNFLKQQGMDGYCEDAVHFLVTAVAIGESLRYAGKFCHTREAYEAVLNLMEEPIHSKDRMLALDEIGKSLQ
jgi:hypothetical protein